MPLNLWLVLAACGGETPRRHGGADAGADAGDAGPIPTCYVAVRVVDEAGAPIEGAVALQGGRPPAEWQTTNADGRADVVVRPIPQSDRWVTAGKRGYYDGGFAIEDACPEGVVPITLALLPDADNAEYDYQEGGSAEHSESSAYCMHCHIEIGAGWNQARHHEALSNPHTRDLFNGSALEATETECAALGGRWEESGVPGSDINELESHCTIGRGVLPDLNGVCGGEGQSPCDHPFADRSGLARLGGCGDCHGAAIPQAVPGAVDLNFAVGATYREGVSCDFCHKIDEVVVGPRPGIDGAIRLRRPSVPSKMATLEWQPIMLGPYPDVLNPLMGGAYQPQFREAGLCSGCHEYAQPALDPADAALVDRAKWPDGIPVHTTYSEWAASPSSPSTPCQECHMPTLHADTSTFDIAAAGMSGSTVNGWFREPGEVRRHDWPSVAVLAPSVVRTQVELADDGAAARAEVTVRNLGAGHALPTGDPMRQVFVLVEATIDGATVPAIGGRAVPDAGGYSVRGEIGADASIAGRDLTIAGASPEGVVVRFVRPTGEWDDYDGPGVGWLSDAARTPEEKGLPVFEVLGETGVLSIAGDVVTLDADPPALLPGDVVYVAREGDLAGAAGWLYAKILVDRDGQRAVHHYRAVDVASDNRIAPTESGQSTHLFPAPAAGSTLQVTARVVYRRQAAAVARVYGWPIEDLEIGRATAERSP